MLIKENTSNPYSINSISMTFFTLRNIILIAVCLQNAGYTLLRKYTTKYENVSSHEILFFSEILKFFFSLYMIYHEKDITAANISVKGEGYSQGNDNMAIFIGKVQWLTINSKKMLILAFIYGVMNILSFISLQYIGAGVSTMTP